MEQSSYSLLYAVHRSWYAWWSELDHSMQTSLEDIIRIWIHSSRAINSAHDFPPRVSSLLHQQRQ